MFRTVDGQYIPSFYYLRIDSSADLTSINGSPEERTLVHEYVHLLQDISLSGNLAFTKEKINFFRGISEVIRSYEGNVSRPVKVVGEELQTNEKYFDELWGNNTTIRSGKIINIETDVKVISAKYGVNVTILRLIIENDEGEEQEYRVGIRDFVENIAALIEQHIYGKHELPDFPYRTIEKIIEHRGLDFSDATISKVCELALFLPDSIPAFINFLNNIGADTDDETLFDVFYKGIVFNDWYGNSYDIEEWVSHCFSTILIDVAEWFNRDFSKDIYEWIELLYQEGEDFRSDKFFISRILELNKDDARNKLFSLMKQTGIPLIINNENHVYTLDSNKSRDTANLLGLEAVEKYYLDNHLDCSLIGFCDQHKVQLGCSFNNNCHFDPKKNAYLGTLCPFAVWIKSLGLHNVVS